MCRHPKSQIATRWVLLSDLSLIIEEEKIMREDPTYFPPLREIIFEEDPRPKTLVIFCDSCKKVLGTENPAKSAKVKNRC